MQGAKESFNDSGEMNDLVHKAESWAIDGGFNRVPEVSLREIQAHRLGSNILTRAVFLLTQQMGASRATIQKYQAQVKEKEEVHINGPEDEEKGKETPPISPMSMTEFRNEIRDCDGSPCTPRTRATLLAEIMSVPKINFMDESPKKLMTPKVQTNKTARKLVSLKLRSPAFTSNPKVTTRKLIKREGRGSAILSPIQPARTFQVQKPIVGDVTPFENRASRLRRQKMEEQRRMSTLHTPKSSSLGFN